MLPEPPRNPAYKRFLLQFHNLLIYVLMAAGLVSIALGHPVDAIVIAAVVLVNAIIGFVQEGRAEQALAAIHAMVTPRASVLRNGKRVTIPAERLVRGDIVLLESGDRAPADIRLLHCRNLHVDESMLTGESAPVEKHTAPVAQGAPLAERTSMTYSGCFVTTGQGVGVAVATAAGTELGRIGALLGAVKSLRTPLIAQMDRFARQVTIIILMLSVAAVMFAVFFRGYSAAEAFMIAVGLAVAAIPEGLPAILTITLSIGVQRMAKRNVIIRKLPAVETLGSVSVICSDKTGTLTRNEMTARSVVTADAQYEIGGEGYIPAGEVTRGGELVDPTAEPLLAELGRAALLCNDSDLRAENGSWRIDGDPMEGALLALARKMKMDPGELRNAYPRIDEIPFDAQHRFMATLHHDGAEKSFIAVKGAPERIVEMCASIRGVGRDEPIDRDAWREAADLLAAQGQRVLGFAVRDAFTGDSLSFADVEGGLVLLGLVGFIDPPRPEAIDAIAECQAAGVRVIMITGDHAVTAREIGQMLGLARNPIVRTGQDLDRVSDEALAAIVRETSIFARTTPEHKLRLVTALQAERLTVSMTGDGVNDAPALKRADVGVAMGQKGTEAAKEAAEIVLADDNFASIVAAVHEGRTVYDNLVKVISWTLPTNGGEALTILLAISLGATLPITPVQILWINLVTAVALGTTLAFEPAEPGLMTRPPRPRNAPLLSADLMWRIFFVSLLFVAGAFGVFQWALGQGLPLETARTLVVNTIVVMEIFYLFSVRYVHGTSLTWRGVLGAPAVFIGVGLCVLAQLAFTYVPLLNSAFASAPLSLTEGLIVIGVGISMLVIVEIEKRVRALFTGPHQAAMGPLDG